MQIQSLLASQASFLVKDPVRRQWKEATSNMNDTLPKTKMFPLKNGWLRDDPFPFGMVTIQRICWF